jgi:hypothetical protein
MPDPTAELSRGVCSYARKFTSLTRFMRFFAPALPWVFLLGAAETAAYAQNDIRLVIRTLDDKITFRIGEVIPIELDFTTSALGTYSLSIPEWDRSGRIDVDQFDIQPTLGWSDPLAVHFRLLISRLGGGPVGFEELSTTPAKIDIALNEWVRFDQPGQHTVAVRSGRVSRLHSASNDSRIEVQSNQLVLTIVPATEAWQQQTLEDAIKLLNSTRPTGTSFPDERRKRAITALRYLGTESAAKALARYTYVGDLEHAAFMGLITLEARSAALSSMKVLLEDPDWPVTPQFLGTMAELCLPIDGKGGWELQFKRQELEKQFVGELLTIVDKKQGEALAVSRNTVRIENSVPDR